MIINLSGNRQMVTSVDGKTGDISTDAITYNQQNLTSEQKEIARSNIGAGESNVLYREFMFTLPNKTSRSWVDNAFSDGTEYFRFASSTTPLNLLTSNDCVFVELNASSIEDAYTMQKEYDKISKVEILDGGIYVYVFGADLPDVELPIKLKVFYDPYLSSSVVS